jgi:hypothetical protein
VSGEEQRVKRKERGSRAQSAQGGRHGGPSLPPLLIHLINRFDGKLSGTGMEIRQSAHSLDGDEVDKVEDGNGAGHSCQHLMAKVIDADHEDSPDSKR